MCVGYGRGKFPSYKKDHQQKHRCSNSSKNYNVALTWRERYPEIRMKLLAGAMPQGPCRLHPNSSGVYGHILALGMIRLDFQFRRTIVATVSMVVWAREDHCRQQNSLEASVVILGKYYGCLNVGSCNGEGEK